MLTETDIVLRLIVAAFLGAVVGYQREKSDEAAGLRTHMLVCMGSALFTVLSMGFDGSSADPTRIAAGIVTGIGFLGAGTIFRAENHVKGLTTAASVWAIAAVGLAAGLGYFIAAAVATAIVFIILSLKKLVKHA
ncbi:MAG: MgtC/SapB family protein [Candidatus Diapherotrites archaeon]